MPAPTVRTGAMRVVEDPTLVPGRSIGLVTNFTAVMPDLGRTVDALLAAGVPVTALFTPEHGMSGSAQAGESEPGGVDRVTGLPVIDTYLREGAELDALVAESGVDALVFDMQDLGLRFYTYAWTMHDTLLAAARLGLPYAVLDRPNPLGGELTSGPVLRPGFESFVGRAAVPIRTGLTVGELARWLNTEHVPRLAGRAADLSVVELEGWRRSATFDRTGLPWVPPSPNLPTLDAAFCYAGTCLVEGTNLSEGRGTTRPFEYIGAPWIDERWVCGLRSSGLPGVAFRDLTFVPTFGKYAGQACRGVQLHVLDRDAFSPLVTALTMLQSARDLHPQFGTRDDEGIDDGRPGSFALDRLWGSDALRLALLEGRPVLDLLPPDRPTAEAYPGWSPTR